MEKTKEISVFIDESGSFDREDIASRYYLVCLVFHDQAVDLTEHFAKFDEELRNLGLGESHCIHAGPLIRREQDYRNMNREERRFIFSKMLGIRTKGRILVQMLSRGQTFRLHHRSDARRPASADPRFSHRQRADA